MYSVTEMSRQITPTGSVPLADSAVLAMNQAVRRTWIVLGLLVVGLGTLAAAVPFGGAVIVAGQVGVESFVKRVSHPTGGVVDRVLVKNGEKVRKGQSLILLESKVSQSEAMLTELSVEQLLARRARLEAEVSGATAISFPPELARSPSSGAKSAMAFEQAQWQARGGERSSEAGKLNARIEQLQQQISGNSAQIAALRRQSVLLSQETEGVRELWAKKLVTLGKLNQLERAGADIDGRLGALTASSAQARAQIAETRQLILQTGQSRRVQAGDQLTEVNDAINRQQMQRASAKDEFDRSRITAPQDGTVDKLTITAAGAVIRPGDTLLEIVPDKDRLVIEAMVRPTDIDQVSMGQKAHVRFSSINVAATPEVAGKVIFVASERTMIRDGQESLFPVRIAIDQAAIEREGIRLRPGLPVEAYIETGRRSMLSYLTKPMRDQMARLFREN